MFESGLSDSAVTSANGYCEGMEMKITKETERKTWRKNKIKYDMQEGDREKVTVEEGGTRDKLFISPTQFSHYPCITFYFTV